MRLRDEKFKFISSISLSKHLENHFFFSWFSFQFDVDFHLIFVSLFVGAASCWMEIISLRMAEVWGKRKAFIYSFWRLHFRFSLFRTIHIMCWYRFISWTNNTHSSSVDRARIIIVKKKSIISFVVHSYFSAKLDIFTLSRIHSSKFHFLLSIQLDALRFCPLFTHFLNLYLWLFSASKNFMSFLYCINKKKMWAKKGIVDDVLVWSGKERESVSRFIAKKYFLS